jgi:ABC-type Mn2+/Zn2+ transport system ATPase subunit
VIKRALGRVDDDQRLAVRRRLDAVGVVAGQLLPIAAQGDLLDRVRRWHDEARTVVAVLPDLDVVRRVFPETLLIARQPIAWGETGGVLSAANLLRARRMIEAHDPHAEVCERGTASA